MIRALIFDLDDTLVSEKEFVDSGYRVIAKELSSKYHLNEIKTLEKLKEEFQVSSKNVFNRVMDFYNLDYSLDYINFLVKLYRQHNPQLVGYPNIKKELIELRAKGFKLGIITDGFAISQKNKISSLNFQDYFDEIIVTDEYGIDYWKPSVKPFEMMKNRLRVNFDEMVYIGDNPNKDFYIKKVCPIKTVRIYRPEGVYANDDYLENIREDFTITSIQEIKNIFN